MGLVLEQDLNGTNDDSSVKITSMTGHAAEASKGGMIDACIGDVVVKVDNKDCTNWTLDEILEEIGNLDLDEPVDLTLQRPATAIPVKFMDTGACVCALPQMSIGALGFQACSEITYECRNGNCGTCQHVMVTHFMDGTTKQQYVRPCVAKVPKGVSSVAIIACHDYDEDCMLY